MNAGRSNTHPEQLDSYYNVFSSQFMTRCLLKFLIFAALGLALGFGSECYPKTDFYVGFGVGTGSCFLYVVLFIFESKLIKVNRQVTEICIHIFLLLSMMHCRYV